MNPDSFGLHFPFLLISDGSQNEQIAHQLLSTAAERLAVAAGQVELPEVQSPVIVDASSYATRSTIQTLQSTQTTAPGLIGIGWHDRKATKPSTTDHSLPSESLLARLLRNTTCPILIAPTPVDRDWQPSWKRVLLVVNRSEATQQAIAITRQLIPAGIEQIQILGVQAPLRSPYPLAPFSPLAVPSPSWQLTHSIQQVQREQGDRLVQRTKAALSPSDLTIQTLVEMGEPGPIICRIAQQADVVIIGNALPQWTVSANHHPVFRYARLSPTSHYVIHHAPCPVLLCRAFRQTVPLRIFSPLKIKQQPQERSAQDNV
jgi:nucleotide-binding universal stress UspA family protein